MLRMPIMSGLLAGSLFLVPALAAAQTTDYGVELGRDLPGSSDHTLVSRYDGVSLVSKTATAFKELTLRSARAVGQP